MDKSPSKYLVYTSAGDHSNLYNWLKNADSQKEGKAFDLWVTYYGDQENKYKEFADYYNMHKGGKFPNLYYVYQRWKDILANYEAIFVLDDDIIIGCSAINCLFKIREQYDLWLLQPAFDPKGKISHSITRVTPSFFLRYTNFVEVACPLFRKDKLDKFMEVYDPGLVGWGTDLWYSHLLGEQSGKIAIVDAIACINPHDDTKESGREIDKLEEKGIRIKKWTETKKLHNIQFNGEKGKFQMKVFGYVKEPKSQ
jgi:hypothetical protein